VYDEYNNKAIKDLIEWQRRCCAHDKMSRKRKRHFTPKTCKVGLVLDDCMAERCEDSKGKKSKKVMQSEDIEKVFKLGRHYKLFFICAMQYIKDAPPAIRGNVDYVFVFDTNSGEEKEKLWKEYFNMFTYRDFCKVFSTCVGQKYNCIVLDVRKSRGSPGSGIYFYCATDRTSKAGGAAFQVGRSLFWDLSRYYYQNNMDIDLDPSKIRGCPELDPTKKKEEVAPAPILKSAKKELIVKRKSVAKEPEAAPHSSSHSRDANHSRSSHSRDANYSRDANHSRSSHSRDANYSRSSHSRDANYSRDAGHSHDANYSRSHDAYASAYRGRH
jgi:hypothetical protein